MVIFHEDGTVSMTQAEYDKLEDDSMKLNALVNGGVDNWCNYDDALEEYRAWRDDQQDEEEK